MNFLVDNHYKTIACFKYVGCICSSLFRIQLLKTERGSL